MATYSYIVSECSTSFLPAAAHAEYQQVVPAGDFSLICTLSSTHRTKKPISIGECWMVIGWCKKLTKDRLADQSHGPYISCCSRQNQHNLPCFGSSNSSVAPSSMTWHRSSLQLLKSLMTTSPTLGLRTQWKLSHTGISDQRHSATSWWMTGKMP